MTRNGRGSTTSGAALLAALLLLGGCGALSGLSGRSGASPYPQPTAETPPGPPQPLDRAAADLADALLARAGAVDGRRFPLVIDPFVDRSTGTETAATRAAVFRILQQVRSRYPSVELRPLSPVGIVDKTVVLLGFNVGVIIIGDVA